MDKIFRKTWDALLSKKPHFAEFLERVTIRNIRGIAELTVPFTYPVSVLAGENCSGKSTVLYALACAYRAPEANSWGVTPASLFPDFRPHASKGLPSDWLSVGPAIEYQYQTVGETTRMRWQRTKVWHRISEKQTGGLRIYMRTIKDEADPFALGRVGWSRSFFGQKGGKQPSRPVYMRTLGSVTDLSRVRSHLALARRPDVQLEGIPSSLVYFAEQILPFSYKRLVCLRAEGKRPLLFAEVDIGNGATTYSEFHMSSGERAMLELSLALSQLKGALVLLDEVDVGLHPHTQQKLMLELQRLALRNDLQIVATTHSPAILDCVPEHARLFLERGREGVVLRPAYRDIIQNALYGRSRDVLSILCEDTAAENLIRGALDVLCPELGIRHSDVKIGRDTGADEFGHHFQMLKKFDLAEGFLFVLDGDEAGRKRAEDLRGKETGLAGVLNLPGEAGPEEWIWKALQRDAASYAPIFGMDKEVYFGTLRNKEQMYDGTVGEVAKNRLKSFCDEIERETRHVARVVGRRETESGKGDMAAFKADLKDAIAAWRRE